MSRRSWSGIPAVDLEGANVAWLEEAMGLRQTSWTMQKATKHGKGVVHRSIDRVIERRAKPSPSEGSVGVIRN